MDVLTKCQTIALRVAFHLFYPFEVDEVSTVTSKEKVKF